MGEELSRSQEGIASESKSNRDYEKILGEIDPIVSQENFDANSPQVAEFIQKRVDQLNLNAVPGGLHTGGETARHSGYIHPQSEVYRVAFADPFHVDDNSANTLLMRTLHDFKTAPGWQGKSLRDMVPAAIQLSLTRYFGNAESGQDAEQNNKAFYIDRTNATSDPFSIREMKGKGIAVCAEKSALAQNMLSFMGLGADRIVSDKCVLTEGQKADMHAYNIVHTGKGHFVYDPTNPVVNQQQETGQAISHSPAFYPIRAEQLQAIKDGQTIEVTHTDKTITSDGKAELKTSKRIYGG